MKKYNIKELTYDALMYCIDNEFDVESTKALTLILVPEEHVEQLELLNIKE